VRKNLVRNLEKNYYPPKRLKVKECDLCLKPGVYAIRDRCGRRVDRMDQRCRTHVVYFDDDSQNRLHLIVAPGASTMYAD